MSIKRNNFIITGLFSLLFVLSTVLSAVVAVPKVAAVIEEPCPDGHVVRFNPGTDGPTYSELCANHQTGGPAADDQEAADPSRGSNLQGSCKDTDRDGLLEKSECGIIGYIITFINILSGLVGVVIVIMIAVGGIQYTAARDDPQAVAAAKGRIRNAILALVFYLFGFAFLQWLIPGGIF